MTRIDHYKRRSPFIVLDGDESAGFIPSGYRRPKAWRVWSTGEVEFKLRKDGRWVPMPWERDLLLEIALSYAEDLRGAL